MRANPKPSQLTPELTLTGSNIQSVAGLSSGVGLVCKMFMYTLHKGFPSNPAHLLTSLSLDCSNIPDLRWRSFINTFVSSRTGRSVSDLWFEGDKRVGVLCGKATPQAFDTW